MQYEKQLYAPMTVPFMIFFFAKDSNTFNLMLTGCFLRFLFCFTPCSAFSGKLKKKKVCYWSTQMLVRVYIQLQKAWTFYSFDSKPPRENRRPSWEVCKQRSTYIHNTKREYSIWLRRDAQKLRSSVRLPKGVFFGATSQKKVTDLFILIYSF